MGFDSMNRILEPEIMFDEIQCLQFYNGVPNFVYYEKLNLFFNDELTGTVGELGCGPAVFTKMLRDKYPFIEIDAYDGSETMLKLAKHHIGDLDRITLVQKMIENIDKKYDTIISLNTLHHIHDPNIFWNTVKRMSKQNSKIFIIDLVRPQDENSVEEIVNQSLGINFESDLFRQDFINSLKAAFTKEEVEEQAKGLDCSVTVSQYLGVENIVIKNF